MKFEPQVSSTLDSIDQLALWDAVTSGVRLTELEEKMMHIILDKNAA